MTDRRWVVLDVGETLIDETRVWGCWADQLGVPRLTFFAALGSVLATGGDYGRVFDVFGVTDWRALAPRVEAAYGGFRPDDLYPDALRSVRALTERGLGVAIAANQPAVRADQLRALGFDLAVVAMSDELGVAKPEPAFYRRVIARLGDPRPASVAYVGDRLDNDVRPARAAGLRAVWLRRGPWGVIASDETGDAHLVVDSLDQLVLRIDEAWPD